jgi:hypothetical protein
MLGVLQNEAIKKYGLESGKHYIDDQHPFADAAFCFGICG